MNFSFPLLFPYHALQTTSAFVCNQPHENPRPQSCWTLSSYWDKEVPRNSVCILGCFRDAIKHEYCLKKKALRLHQGCCQHGKWAIIKTSPLSDTDKAKVKVHLCLLHSYFLLSRPEWSWLNHSGGFLLRWPPHSPYITIPLRETKATPPYKTATTTTLCGCGQSSWSSWTFH